MKPRAAFFIPAAIVFLVYVVTLCPVIYVGDSGELVTAAAVLGVAHPPGYPLYVLLGRLFTLLPFGETALRANLLSAMAGAAAAGTLSLLLLFPGGDGRPVRNAGIAGAFTAVFLFSFSRTAWSQMVVAEVYGLNALMTALILLALFRGRRPMLTFFLLGIGAANHQTVLLLLPGIVYYYVATGRMSWRLAARGAAAFAVASTLYLFLLVRPDSPDLFAWRKPSDWTGLFAHITRAQYGSLSKLPRSLPLLASQLAFALRYALKEIPLAVPLVPTALYLAWRRRGDATTKTLSIHFLFTSVGLLLLLNQGTDPLDAAVATVYYIPAVLFAALLMEPLFRAAALRLESIRPSLGYAVTALALIPLIMNYRVCDARTFRLGDQAGRAMLASVEPDGAILTEGDNATFVLYYLHLVEGVRPDVEILDRDLNFFSWKLGVDPTLPGRRSARDRSIYRLVSTGERPVYATGRFEEKEIAGKSLVSVGPLYRFMGPEEELRPASLDLLHREGIDVTHLREDYIARRFAVAYLAKWVDHYGRTGDRVGFEESRARIERIGGDLKEAHLVIGLGDASSGDTTLAVESIEKSLAVDPTFVAARRELANLYVGLENYERAAEEFRLAAERENLAGDWLNLGNSLYFDGREDEAEAAWRKALVAEGVNDRVILGVAKGMGKLKIDSVGVPLLEKLRSRSPGSFREFEDLGDGYDRMGMPEKALDLYRAGIEQDPKNPALRYKAGVALIRLGKTVEAKGELEKALETSGRTPAALNALAYLYSGENRNLPEALDLAEEAVKKASGEEIGYYEDTRGVILSRLGRLDEAEAALRRALEKTPESDRSALVDTWNHLGDLLEKRGDRPGGERCRAKADSLRGL